MSLLLIATVFLPLFPSSIVLNWLLTRLASPLVRFMFLLLWPQIGIALLNLTAQPIADGILVWVLLSSMFYAIRLLTVRDLGLWSGFLACSALPFIWGFANHGDLLEMEFLAVAFSLPAALLALLTRPLTERFGAAFAGLYGGIAGSLPRLSVVLVFSVLAAIATPPTPAFFAMLGLINRLGWPLAPGVLVIWLLWGWAAAKLLQGFMTGDECHETVTDIGRTAAVLYTGLIGIFVVSGLVLTGGML